MRARNKNDENRKGLSMKPITFSCSVTLSLTPNEIAANILDLEKWPEFQGYGLMPGIRSAEFEVETPEVVGTKIRVTNTDNSSHVEEITVWEPDSRVVLRMDEFSPPLSRLANYFLEIWKFEQESGKTRVTRSFELHPRRLLTKLPLWLISFLLKKAIARQLRQMRDGSL